MASCPNPKPISTISATQIGFASLFRPANGEIIFDIAGNTIITNSANSVGVNFEVTDPLGNVHGAIDFPSVDINTLTLGSTYTLTGLSQNSSFFGKWTVKAAFRIDSQDFVITQEYDIVAPTGLTSNNTINGQIKLTVDAINTKLKVEDATSYKYKNFSPISNISTGLLSPTVGADIPITYLPSSISLVGLNRGIFSINGSNLARYEIGCLAIVELEYKYCVQKDVQLGNALCDLACCIKDIIEGCSNNPDLRKKYDKVRPKIDLAELLGSICGEDVTDLVEDIRKELGCECRCKDGRDLEIKDSPIGFAIPATQIFGACGTSVTQIANGDVEIESPIVEFVSFLPNEKLFDIVKEATACGIKYKLKLNCEEIANCIKNYLPAPTNITEGIDWKCIPNGGCMYRVDFVNSTGSLDLINYVDNTTEVPPLPIVLSNNTGVTNWLDTVNNYTGHTYSYVNYTGVGSLVIYSTKKIESLKIGNQAYQFNETCPNPLQAIVDYICEKIKPCASPLFIAEAVDHDTIKVIFLGLNAGETFDVSLNSGTSYIVSNNTNNPLTIDGVSLNSVNPVVVKRNCAGGGSVVSTPILVTMPIPSCSSPLYSLDDLGAGVLQITVSNFVPGNNYVVSVNGVYATTISSAVHVLSLSTGSNLQIGVQHICVNNSSMVVTQNITLVASGGGIGGGSGCVNPIISVNNITAIGATINISNIVVSSTYVVQFLDASNNILSNTTLGGTAFPLTYTTLNSNTVYRVRVTNLGCVSNLAVFTTNVAVNSVSGNYATNALAQTPALSGKYYDGVHCMCFTGNALTVGVYCANPIPAIGDILYTNVGMTVPLSGKNYWRCSTDPSNTIYAINTATGLITGLAQTTNASLAPSICSSC